MAKFNKGDRVRLVTSTRGTEGVGLELGQEGTVSEADSWNPNVTWDGLTTGHAGGRDDFSKTDWAVEEYNLELIEPLAALASLAGASQ